MTRQEVSSLHLPPDLRAAWQEPRRAIRIALIQPSGKGGVRSLLPQVEEDGDGIGFKPPLGLLYLAATIQEFSPHQVQVIDANARRLDPDAVVRVLETFRPDLVGVSAWTDLWYPAFHLGKTIKERMPGIHLCYGGPHVGIFPRETLGFPFVDSVVVGDGEIPFLFLSNMLANHQFGRAVPGLHFKEGGVKPGEQECFVQENLDRLPFPDRTNLPLESYGSVLSGERFSTTMITSRGCPHHCVFCRLGFQKTISRSARNVVEEFRQIKALGIREVELYDDTFTWSKDRVRAICQELISADLGVEWAVRDRVNNADQGLYRLMFKAGCRRIHLGIESGVQQVLNGMKKNITVQQAMDAVRWAREAGFVILTYFMFGNLDEDSRQMRKTMAFALELNADYCEFSITVPYPGTALYEEALRRGIIRTDFWQTYAQHPTPGFVLPQVIENRVGLPGLIRLRNLANRRFYFRPRYLLRQFSRLRSWAELRKKARMALLLATNSFRSRP